MRENIAFIALGAAVGMAVYIAIGGENYAVMFLLSPLASAVGVALAGSR